ncbi:MarR family winged helix-turn-helix transcriptional regulator [Epibacterium ulvae]|uniref:MarR family winged helix-turn-helix transcriptional regulator n=1 Tax=Epibacterium ulvae TaxID=1156985 RepID=UPI00248FC9F8|nr:MarR family transcriptional regulator [Epibacterium ulvae]
MQADVTDKDGKLRVDQQFCFALYSSSRAVTKAYSILLEELGVTYPQYAALMLLWEQDGILISDIATSLELDGGTATPLVQRLEKLGLVARVRCDEDERRVRVFLTDEGKALFYKALEIPHGLGEATGLDGPTAHRIVDEMQDIKANIADWLSETRK